MEILREYEFMRLEKSGGFEVAVMRIMSVLISPNWVSNLVLEI
jgi:hypothetical protein